MANNNLLLYGGVAVAAILLYNRYKKKPESTTQGGGGGGGGGTIILPPSPVAPSTPVSVTISSMPVTPPSGATAAKEGASSPISAGSTATADKILKDSGILLPPPTPTSTGGVYVPTPTSGSVVIPSGATDTGMGTMTLPSSATSGLGDKVILKFSGYGKELFLSDIRKN